MRILVGALLITLITHTAFADGHSKTMRIVLVSNAPNAAGSWRLKVIQEGTDGQVEIDIAIGDADVKAYQRGQIVDQGKTNPTGIVEFSNLKPEYGPVTVIAKRSGLLNFKTDFQWKLPDSQIVMANNRAKAPGWTATSSDATSACVAAPQYCASYAPSAACAYTAAYAPPQHYCCPTYQTHYGCEQQYSTTYVQCPAPVTYYAPAW